MMGWLVIFVHVFKTWITILYFIVLPLVMGNGYKQLMDFYKFIIKNYLV